MIQPRVVDISHHNKVTDLKDTAAAGIWGVIHKASQGQSYRDPDYASRREQARAAGLLWGAYHFNDGTNVAGQVENLLKAAAPDEGTLLVLDFEDNPKSNMSVQQAVQFLRLLEQKTGRKGAIYSGNRLKENIAKLSSADRVYICSHRLWLCQYGPRAVLPAGFTEYWLWQYTGDGIGPEPHSVAGIAGTGIDLNAYQGDLAKLTEEWAPSSLLGALTVSSRSDDAEAGQSSHARQAASDENSGSRPQPSGMSAPIDADVQGDPELYSVQKRLKAMHYSPGVLDGKWGGGTSGAISSFVNDRGGHIAVPASLEAFNDVRDELKVEIAQAEAESFVRPVTEARKTADPAIVATVAPEVVPAKRNFFASVAAAITAFFGALWNTLSSWVDQAWDLFSDHKDDLPSDPSFMSSVWEYLGKVPTGIWFLLAAIGLGLLAWNAHSSVKKITSAVQTGARQ
ncbi:glycoside hydrolase family 25 protein [Bradyrhizobium cenepequi]